MASPPDMESLSSEDCEISLLDVEARRTTGPKSPKPDVPKPTDDVKAVQAFLYRYFCHRGFTESHALELAKFWQANGHALYASTKNAMERYFPFAGGILFDDLQQGRYGKVFQYQLQTITSMSYRFLI